MTREPVRRLLSVVGVGVLASCLALPQALGATTASERFAATFTESNQSVTNRMTDLGVFQLINTGSGTFGPYGPATVVLAMSQDRSVEPCGPGSWTNAGTRRITLRAGVLILRETAEVCDTEIGFVGRGIWTVDGASSTGPFAGARGGGRIGVYLPARMTTLWGTLKLRFGST